MTVVFTSCEDVIEVNLENGAQQLNVDAMINNSSEKQTIKLSKTNSYFSNETLPAITNAEVFVIDNVGNSYSFSHESEGNYIWTPTPTDTLNMIGGEYTLIIKYQNEEYRAKSQLNPVPQIDSIGSEFRVANGPSPEGYYAILYAFDIAGRSDYYWIKTYKNNTYVNGPQNINIAADAAFPPNGSADGFLFIPPIRYGITPFGEVYKAGDTVNVEILSITAETYDFLAEAKAQMINEGLFAKPPSNVRTNIYNVTNPDTKAVGWFCVSAISVMKKEIR